MVFRNQQNESSTMKDSAENASDFLKRFWDKRILSWEGSRYESLASPILYWQIRYRLKKALKLLWEPPSYTSVLELGCGSGRLALGLKGKKYRGIDFSQAAIARALDRRLDCEFLCLDVRNCEEHFVGFDITVFLGLTDWLTPKELEKLVVSLQSPWLLFSYTKAKRSKIWHVYGIYRRLTQKFEGRKDFPLAYDETEVLSLLKKGGYRVVKRAQSYFSPGVLVIAKRE